MLCVCVAHVVEKAVRDARVAESQAERVAQARVRAARLTDLPFLLAGAAEQGAIAARGDAMVNNNDFFPTIPSYRPAPLLFFNVAMTYWDIAQTETDSFNWDTNPTN